MDELSVRHETSGGRSGVQIQIGICYAAEGEGLPLPTYATEHSAGMDLYAAIPVGGGVTLGPGERVLLTTGVRLILPEGYEGQIRARSGLAVRHGIGILNGPGTIDSDYRGIVQVLLVNWGQQPFEIARGDRIAQLVVAPVTRALPVRVDTYESTDRGDGGFGSTGTR